ncbi:MAG: transcription antitermination factor NusB [Desulfovibrionaceae bacterium]|nr:transcription antitermination factor NusB [Desulfovibrionaceae bacterium]MBF0512985.1 transcription antitermination factor NusB [Desulfovibrionaceae bacterium]
MSLDKSARRGSRRRAFQILYSLGFAETESEAGLSKMYSLSPHGDLGETIGGDDPFAWELVRGAWPHFAAIDATIAEYSRNWRVGRIGRVEMAILRLALHELLHCPQTPARVVINEAVELAKRYGDENSKNFINGILDAVARSQPGQKK